MLRIDEYQAVYVGRDYIDEETLSPGVMLLLGEDRDKPHSLIFLCPCGCGDEVHIPTKAMAGTDRSWSLVIDESSRPTLSPSLQRTVGCRSHFFVTSGKVRWC